ncbi:far upstream element-binding protein 1 isoform X6 [Diorhabda carinulata]|uniref:far upstream element-binding protein 1 isoform X6 n=1 Tax=Diorhabda sublineata TaxID=1163346 RepID=UPI0024E159C8|nr:far upstream element-binding protein 1 isoform X6 [Diorhabda sublineata]XP_057663459.1 far upstream element-binding protein 1 isoform X6 [Diorhabda carinulata]XP_057663467.1 far upstream element-binding protein 1 isoform X6 [Diorhabda carinulata]
MSDYSAVAPPPQQNFNQSSAFAAALQRAKQIAAKINPGAGTNDNRQKRPLEDGADLFDAEPDAKKGPGAVGPPQNQGPPALVRPQQNQAMGGPTGMGGMQQVNEDISVPDKMVGLRINNMGMGGPGAGPGGRNSIEIMIPGPKVGLIIGKGGETIKQLQEKSGAKMVVIQDGPNQEHEKPLVISGDPQKVEYAKQLVYDLIAEKEMKNFNRGGGRGRQGPNDGYNDYGSGGGDSIEVLVPRTAVGVVIGKGGDMIKKIQSETGAKVQFQQARDEGPGDRRCFLSGNSKQVEMARQRIDELIDSVLQRDNGGDGMGGGPMGGGMRGGRGGGRGGRGGHHGGRGGGGFDRGDRNGGGDFGGNQWDDRRGGGGGGPGGHHGAPQDVVSFTVPANKCGVIIGRGGETIKQINQQSGAYCKLDIRSQNPNSNEKVFLIKGDPDSIETAKRILQDKVQMPLNFVSQGGPQMSSMPTAYPGMAPQSYNPQNNWALQGAGGGGGTPGGGYQQQQWGGQPQGGDSQPAPGAPVNPSGQPDYSMQWAEYYRTLGMHREADMIEQAKAKAGGAAAPGMPQGGQIAQGAAPATQAVPPSSGAQADFSAQWAEYYRSIGKIEEAKAIEAQMKTKTGTTAPNSGVPTAPGTQTGGYSQPQTQTAYGGYQPQATAGYYGGQPQGAPVPGVPQGGYGFPSYGYGGQQGGGGGGPSQD